MFLAQGDMGTLDGPSRFMGDLGCAPMSASNKQTISHTELRGADPKNTLGKRSASRATMLRLQAST